MRLSFVSSFSSWYHSFSFRTSGISTLIVVDDFLFLFLYYSLSIHILKLTNIKKYKSYSLKCMLLRKFDLISSALCALPAYNSRPRMLPPKQRSFFSSSCPKRKRLPSASCVDFKSFTDSVPFTNTDILPSFVHDKVTDVHRSGLSNFNEPNDFSVPTHPSELT